MTWSIETDDFLGVCGREFDLIRSMKEGFNVPVGSSSEMFLFFYTKLSDSP